MTHPKLTPADEPAIVAIVAGLLASGHFTIAPGTTAPDSDPAVYRTDFGKDFHENNLPVRFGSLEVEEAMNILQELKAELARAD